MVEHLPSLRKALGFILAPKKEKKIGRSQKREKEGVFATLPTIQREVAKKQSGRCPWSCTPWWPVCVLSWCSSLREQMEIV
jgi:hypothetical protein